MSPLPGDR